MMILRKALSLLGLVVIAAADLLIYQNIHLFYQAEKAAGEEKQIELLTRAARIFPLNDLVAYTLGKAYFSLAMREIHDPQIAPTLLKKAHDNFLRSIRLNPTSPFSHFYFAQSLLHLSLLSGSSDPSFYEGFKRAAELSAENSQVFYEVGKVSLSLWHRLSEPDRRSGLDIVKKIMVGKDVERIGSLIRLWLLDVGDLDKLESLLPQDAEIFRLYADFLGESGISPVRRQKFLAQAELMEFESAKSDFQKGENAAFYYEWDEAEEHFQLCLSRLKRIHFYQDLASQQWIDPSEYDRLLGSCHFSLAKCRLASGKEFLDVENDLREFLRLERDPSSLLELENELVGRGLIKEKLPEKFDDMKLVSLQLDLFYRQNRFSEIMNFGRFLQRSIVVVPEEQKKDYVRVLHIVGDTLQKLNYFYEASDFYQKALELDQTNIETLTRIRQNYANLNNRAKVEETERMIGEMITSRIQFGHVILDKGAMFSLPVICDGRQMMLELGLDTEKGPAPLISIFFNGRIVWENTPEGTAITCPVSSKIGENILGLVSLNRSAGLESLVCRNKDETKILFRR